MRIEGKEIASQILSDLAKKVAELKKSGVTPTMAIFLMGNNQASEIYVKQKILKAESIGAKVKLFRFPTGATNKKIEKELHKLIVDKNIHGIILQRPAPENVNADMLTELVPPLKEIDGFGTSPAHPVPVAQAVFELLKDVHRKAHQDKNFIDWLKSKKVVLIGKGETAGKPIIEHFRKHGLVPIIVDSKTKDRSSMLKSADIIISSVGKKVINSKEVKKGVILISVGLFTNSEGKLNGDYDDNEIKNIASFYSPTPGGVGPVNVACLLKNLIKSAETTHS